MPTERTTRTETTTHSIKPAETIVEPTKEVVEKRVETTETFPAEAPKNANINVTTNPDPAAGGQVSVNTPDGTQVNINK